MTLDKNTDYTTLLEMWREEKQKRIKAEEALTKALMGDHRVAESDKIIMEKVEEIERLKADLARKEEDRQYDKMVHDRELADLFRGKYDKEK